MTHASTSLAQLTGSARYWRRWEPQEVHRDECGVLLKRFVLYEPARSIVAVRVVNSTPEPDGSEYVLQVARDCKTAREAVAWTFELEAREYRPTVETQRTHHGRKP